MPWLRLWCCVAILAGASAAAGGDPPCVTIITPGKVWAVAFAPDGKTVATGGNELILWDAATGHRVRTFEGTRFVAALAFSPDGSMLATAGIIPPASAAEVRLWNPATGKLIRDLAGIEKLARCITFSPDGRRVAAAGAHPSGIVIWDAMSGRTVGRFAGHTDSVRIIAFAPDGRGAASTGNDNQIRVWGTRPVMAFLHNRISPSSRSAIQLASSRSASSWMA